MVLARAPPDWSQVVPKVGFCISTYDILKASDGLIGHGTGNANVMGMAQLRQDLYSG